MFKVGPSVVREKEAEQLLYKCVCSRLKEAEQLLYKCVQGCSVSGAGEGGGAAALKVCVFKVGPSVVREKEAEQLLYKCVCSRLVRQWCGRRRRSSCNRIFPFSSLLSQVGFIMHFFNRP